MKNEDISTLKKEARSMSLVYTPDSIPGYTRKLSGKSFIFFDTEGKRITDKEEITRIKGLVLPPAWQRVWICPKANGHLQATGYDVAGRKQYKYHTQWSQVRNHKKHNRMSEFANALPLIRKKVNSDLRKKEFSKEKVIALAVSIMDKTFIRVGNATYAKLYGSFGLTSLRNRHVHIKGNKMTIAFKGKKGVFQEIPLTHTGLVKMISKLKDIPGQELFQFYDKDGSKKSLDSDSVNTYIEACTGENFTAKDFRTWWGTVTAASQLAAMEPFSSAAESQRNLVSALDHVAKKLGNTRTVCKKYYVHPTLIGYYQEGKLDKYLSKLRNIKSNQKTNLLKAEENVVRDFIRKECK